MSLSGAIPHCGTKISGCDGTRGGALYITERRAFPCGTRNSSKKAGLSDLDTQVSTSCALCAGSVPPSTHDTLNSERLPQTQQVSCGLSLITSQSAQSTAFCKQTALRFELLLSSMSTPWVVHFKRLALRNAREIIVTVPVLEIDVRKVRSFAVWRLPPLHLRPLGLQKENLLKKMTFAIG